jgi:hypothetical protein
MAAMFAFGLVFHFLNGSGPASKTQGSSGAFFVGSETCAGCHEGEAKLWNASQHKAALQLSPQYATAAINLADLYRQLGRDNEGENVLRSALVASPREAPRIMRSA